MLQNDRLPRVGGSFGLEHKAGVPLHFVLAQVSHGGCLAASPSPTRGTRTWCGLARPAWSSVISPSSGYVGGMLTVVKRIFITGLVALVMAWATGVEFAITLMGISAALWGFARGWAFHHAVWITGLFWTATFFALNVVVPEVVGTEGLTTSGRDHELARQHPIYWALAVAGPVATMLALGAGPGGRQKS